jgi:hypothetical protein
MKYCQRIRYAGLSGTFSSKYGNTHAKTGAAYLAI